MRRGHGGGADAARLGGGVGHDADFAISIGGAPVNPRRQLPDTAASRLFTCATGT